MNLNLHGTAKCGKELKVKREKQDSVEVLHCHLVLDEIFVDRRAIDVLCGQPRGWANDALFDALGAPRMRMVIRLKDLQLDAEGRVFREVPHPGNSLDLKGTKATKIELELIAGGALMKIRFTWNTAGDEAEDCSGLLARDVEAKIILTAAPQVDALKPDSPAVKGPRKGKKPATVVDRDTGEVISGGNGAEHD